jgi:hypothetical protein
MYSVALQENPLKEGFSLLPAVVVQFILVLFLLYWVIQTVLLKRIEPEHYHEGAGASKQTPKH